jgi:AcrR family transcriptional regulator
LERRRLRLRPSACGPSGRSALGSGEAAIAGQDRPQRADARSNRARILDAALEVFGRGGETASTEEVARLAGVGIGTVFRHFPAKADLLDAVLVRRFDRLQARAEWLAASEDPGRALFDLFSEMVSDAPSKIAIADALTEAGGGTDSLADRASARLSQAVGVLLGRAQAAGAIRADVELPELYALLIGMSRAGAYAQLDHDVRTRAVAVIFDGLAAPRPGVPGAPSGA